LFHFGSALPVLLFIRFFLLPACDLSSHLSLLSLLFSKAPITLS
jgi:hypothetical protein